MRAREILTMKKIERRLLRRAALSLSCAGLFVWLAVWAVGQALGLVGAGLFQGEDERIQKLEEQRRETLQRVERRQKVVAAVIAARMTLTEAAALFRDLNRSSRSFSLDLFRRSFDGATDEERHCRQVIASVRSQLELYPGADNEVVQ